MAGQVAAWCFAALVLCGGLLMIVDLALQIRRFNRVLGQQVRSLSPRDGGLPQNIIPPRSRWEYARAAAPIGLHAHVKRTRRAEVAHSFGPSYIEKWASWEIVVVCGGVQRTLWRITERWADHFA